MLDPFIVHEFELLNENYRKLFDSERIIYFYIDWTVTNDFKNPSFVRFCEEVDEVDLVLYRESEEIENAVKRILKESGEEKAFQEFVLTLKY